MIFVILVLFDLQAVINRISDNVSQSLIFFFLKYNKQFRAWGQRKKEAAFKGSLSLNIRL